MRINERAPVVKILWLVEYTRCTSWTTEVSASIIYRLNDKRESLIHHGDVDVVMLCDLYEYFVLKMGEKL